MRITIETPTLTIIFDPQIERVILIPCVGKPLQVSPDELLQALDRVANDRSLT